MIAASIAIPRIVHHLAYSGWQVKTNVKLRGRISDLVAIKDGKICTVEVKASGDIQSSIEQALHLKKAANFSYLAIPDERVDERLIDTCKNLGIGLMTFDDVVKELVKPAQSEPLPSIKWNLLGLKPDRKRVLSPGAKSLGTFIPNKRGNTDHAAVLSES